jgi:cysteinyl-tRNA synthetase
LFKLRNLLSNWGDNGQINQDYKNQFIELMSNDLLTSEALALIWKLTKDENIKNEDKKATIVDFDKVLDLDLNKKMEDEKIPQEIWDLVDKRKKAREEKNWLESDRLREEIKNKGYLVEDLQDECKIRKINK